MSEASIITIAAAFMVALPPTLLALASLIQSIKTNRKVEDTEKKVVNAHTAIVEVIKKTDDQTLKIDAVNTKAEVIQGHVNSEKTAAHGREAMLAAENKLLREMMIVLERSATSAVQSVSRPTIQVLEQIDRRGEQSEKNTASAEANVDALKSEDR